MHKVWRERVEKKKHKKEKKIIKKHRFNNGKRTGTGV